MLLLLIPSAHADQVARPDSVKMVPATELVRILRADELYRNMSLNGAREQHREGKLTAKQLQCYEGWKLEEFTRRVAEVFARDMYIEEIQSAVDFYSSPTGAKFLHMAYQLNWERTPEQFPLRIEGPKQAMNYGTRRPHGRLPR